MKANPLLDYEFLYKLDTHRNRVTYVRITSLNLNSYPIEQIEGVATGGSITIDGDSSVRRICNLTMSTKNLNINRVYWGITTKVKIEIGLENNVFNSIINYQEKYGNIIWFPMGTFVLTEFRTSSQVNNYTITLSGKDKMCLLNGDISGQFNAETDLGTEEVWNFETKSFDKIKRPINYIIREMVHHYAQEDYSNIIIKDIVSGYDMLANYTGHTIYVIENYPDENVIELILDTDTNNKKYWYADSSVEPQGTIVNFSELNHKGKFRYKITVDEDDDGLVQTQIKFTPITDSTGQTYSVRAIYEGEALGYTTRELEYPDDLIAAIGDTATSILDKIVQTFPNYEYFYNAAGQFVFQEKQTYVNSVWNNVIREDRENYVNPSSVSSKAMYNFEGSVLTTAYQNTPKIGDIKNDYTVWGKKKTSSGFEVPIHMRYAIDKKPSVYFPFKRSENEEKPMIYCTEEFYKEYIGSTISNTYKMSLETKKRPPDFLLSATYYDYEAFRASKKSSPTDDMVITYDEEKLNEMWWTVLDWGAYFQELTGERPNRILMNYGTIPCCASIAFPGEQRARFLRSQLIFDLDRSTGKPHTGNTFIYDRELQAWSPFQHGFNGCGHTFDFFMDLDEANAVDSWIFCPQIPELDKSKIIEDEYDVHIVDWREIIYQMALDYYAHNHEDDYGAMLYKNNKNEQYGVDQFNNGHTGYEQYYHDIQGFWRNLYVPKEERDIYFSNYRTFVATSHYMPDNFIFNDNNSTYNYLGESESTDQTFNYVRKKFLVRRTDGDYELYAEDDETETFSLNLLVNRDKELDKIKNVITNSLQQKQKLEEELLEEKNGVEIIENDPQKYLSYQFYTHENQKFICKNEDSIDEDIIINYCVLNKAPSGNTEKGIYRDIIKIIVRGEMINTLSSTIAQLQDKIKSYQVMYEAGEKAIAPYNFIYNCEKDEDEFYGDIVYTTHGFPIYKEMAPEDRLWYGDWAKAVKDRPSSLIFWFDFFDADSLGLGQFSVVAIGDRPKTVNNDSIRAIIYQDVPDVLFIGEEDKETILAAQLDGNYSIIIMPFSEPLENETEEDKISHMGFLRYYIENGKIVRSSRRTTAQEEIDNLLYTHGYCNENITITSIPIYYLDPNVIISAEDEQRIVNGYYILNKMTIPLNYNGTMQNTATKVPERIY